MIDLKLSKNEQEGLTEDECILAKARKLELLTLPHLRRNIDFFYAGGNLEKKSKAYHKEIEREAFKESLKVKNTVTSTVCKPLCEMVSEILQENGINAETVSCDSDIFRHTDVLITTPSGRKYIINYLEEMENIQTGMYTPEFASEMYYVRRYKKFGNGYSADNKSLKGLSFIDKDTLGLIDSNLGYKKHNMYMDDVIEQIRTEFEDFRNIMAENEYLTEQKRNSTVNKEDIYYKWNNMSDNEILERKLDWIFEYFNDRMDIKGHTDFVMYYSRLLLQQVLSKEEYNALTRYNCFLYKDDIPEHSKISNILDFENDENYPKVRFCLLQYGNKYYAFSTKSNSYIKLNEEEVKNLEKYAKIVKSQKPSDLVLQLSDRGKAGPLLFHPIGSKILDERASLIDESLSYVQKKAETDKLIQSIKTTDGKITSITIPYPNGEEKYLYIDKNKEFVVHSKLENTTTIYHYNEATDSFSEEKIPSNEER